MNPAGMTIARLEVAMTTQKVHFISLNLTPQVGANDAILRLRVLPDGREGKTAYARTLRDGELDTGESVIFDPNVGETLDFRPGAIEVTLRAVDEFLRHSNPPAGPWDSISLSLLTWLTLGRPKNAALVRYLQAAGRRLDAAADLFVEIDRGLPASHDSVVEQGRQLLRNLSSAELMMVAFGRTLDMLISLRDYFPVSPPLPVALTSKAEAIRSMRNAFEHIEDRAFGKVRGKTHPDALTTFEQSAFFERGIISYASHSIDLRLEGPELFSLARAYICAVASEAGGIVIKSNTAVGFFRQAAATTAR